ncbi:MAG: iron ABC transporter permease [Pseudomonadota bacterium]|nr:iron ABC transporter permease [Pseudomonadota bacterium]
MKLAWLALLLVIPLALGVGPAGVDPAVIVALRLPRVAGAVVGGAGLALAGVLMQTLLRNALAEPFVLGMSSGAALGAVLAVLVAPMVPPALPAAVGALAAASLVGGLAQGTGATRLLLSGVAVASVLGAATALLLQLAPDASVVRAALFWTAGSLASVSLPGAGVAGCLVVAGTAWAIRVAPSLDRLLLGEDTAAALGVDVGRVRVALIVLGSALTGALVAMAGPIGFVGLAAPHLARMRVGALHRPLVGIVLPLGALLLLGADTLGRTLATPRELPVGLVTAAVGGPFFLWLLRGRAYQFGEAGC